MNRMLALPLLGLLVFLKYPVSAQDVSDVVEKPVAEVRADFLKLLDRPKIPLDIRTTAEKSPEESLVVEHVDFATEKRADGTVERVPGLVYRNKGLKPGEKQPAVLVLHGTGGNKDGLRPWLNRLAARGIIAIGIDGRYHGDRNHGPKGTAAYNAAIVEAWRTKPGEPQSHPFYYDTCWDIWRTIDYLQSRPDVDPDRIGVTGTSKGGIEAWLAGAVDERVKVAVPAIGVQSFRWSLEHERWQARANTIKEAHEVAAKDLGEAGVNARVCRELWSKVIPGILDEFDGPSMLRLFADRSLLILNGERDPNCPIEGAELAFASAKNAFHRAGRDDHLQIFVASGVAHAVTREQQDAAIDWLARWLGPISNPTANVPEK